MRDFFEDLFTPHDIQMHIADNLKKKRKEANLRQEELSNKANVSFGSLKRFENKGEISLKSLIKIAIALKCENELYELFTKKKYNSIEEIINENN